MKKLIAAIVIMLTVNCNQQKAKNDKDVASKETKDSLVAKPIADSDSFNHFKDSLLLHLSAEILNVIKTKDFKKLSSYVHPALGIRFSPYAFIDTLTHQRMLPAELSTPGRQKKVLIWGLHDGSGEPIRSDLNKYINEFVYDADFLTAPQKSVNKTLAAGNSLNNLKLIYPNADFTEFYFPGFDPKYGGMDWKTLRLAFQTENNRPWLIAIVHDEWTI